MIFLTYNTRGIGGKVKRRAIRNLIQSEKVDFVCLQETKADLVNDGMCQSLWGNEEIEWIHSPAINHGGGILCIWRKGCFSVSSVTCNPSWIGLKGRLLGRDDDCVLINVYAPCSFEGKRQLWGEISDWKTRNDANLCCIMGDFNSVRSEVERRGVGTVTSHHRRDSDMFNDFIETIEVVDIPLTRKKFTWVRPNGSAMSRLDRCMVSIGWLEAWPLSIQQAQDRDISDHCPILLKQLHLEWGPKPFRVLNCWQQDPRFDKFVPECWSKLDVQGRGLFVLKEKLKILKGNLKRWNSEIFGDVNTKKKETVDRINALELKAEVSPLLEEELAERKLLSVEFWRVSKLQESLLSQKSRIRWLREGDENSRFFHGMVKWRHRANSINGLLLNGEWVDEPAAVKEGVKLFFERKFKEVESEDPNLDGISFNQLSDGDNNWLVEDFDMAEIKTAVWECEGNKSPGPDGYNFSFLKKFWDLVSVDVKRMVDDFSIHDRWPRGTNSSFITLIPKCASPQGLNDFRPISLVGCLYKIITKILAARMKRVLPKVIHDTQYAFLEGRGMLDSVVIANEVIHEAKSVGMSAMVFKVDFEKAYDSVRWKFLFYMLRRMNFGEKWIKWVKGCLESSYVSVLVNGSPTNEFKMEKGVRQGDPLAPFLFLVVAEGLNGLLREAVLKEKFKPCKVGRGLGVEVGLLQFADDALFLGEASLSNMVTLKCILRCFELVSGMKINFHKSKIAGIAVTDPITNQFAALLNCKVMSIPFIYLGLPVGANPRRLATWDPMLNKIRSRLSSWKAKKLSFGGRVCLVKSVLTALPLYFISFFRMPKGIVKKCQQLMARFLWGGSDDVRKIAWVGWDQCCKPKSEGGLGLRDLESFNLALLGKWRWRILHEKESLWCQVLMAKYGDGISSKFSVWWKDLLLSCVGPESGNWFENGLCWRLGDGADTSFWEDNWHGKGSFRVSFDGLYAISQQKNLKLSEMGSWTDGVWKWDLQWSTSVEGENVLKLGVLAQIISSFSLTRGGKDKWVWVKDSSGSYSVSSAYESIFEFETDDFGHVYASIWRSWAPSNARAFGWRVLLNRIQTKSNLVKRNIPIHNSVCTWCGIEEETTPHLLFHCSFAWKVWSTILKWLGFSLVLPGDQKDHFYQFTSACFLPKRNGLSTIWLSVIWHLWISRNGSVFREEEAEASRIVEDVKAKAWFWLRGRNKSFIHCISEWHSHPMDCLKDM